MRISLALRMIWAHLMRNPGSLFIVAFVVTLLIGAATYEVYPLIADELVTIMFFALAYGLLLESIALLKNRLNARHHAFVNTANGMRPEPNLHK